MIILVLVAFVVGVFVGMLRVSWIEAKAKRIVSG